MRHLSIGMEALGDIPGTCTPLTLGAWLGYPGQEVVRDPLSLSRQYVSAVLRSAIHGLLQIRHPLCLSSRHPRPDHPLDILRLSLPPSPIHIGAPPNPGYFQTHPFSSSFLGHYPTAKYHTSTLDHPFILNQLPLPFFNFEANPFLTTSSFSEDSCLIRPQLLQPFQLYINFFIPLPS
jgi:hypothetical protein